MSEVQNHPGSKHADSRLLDVVALVKRGDAMAFEELYRLTYKYAYFHAKSILHDDDEAWDLVQETYIAVYQHIDSLREERYVKSWISGIVFNLGMKRLRKKRDLLVDGENDFLFDALEDENTDGSPEKALDSKETAAIVREVAHPDIIDINMGCPVPKVANNGDRPAARPAEGRRNRVLF